MFTELKFDGLKGVVGNFTSELDTAQTGRHKDLKIHIQGKREAVEQWKMVYLICYKVMRGERMFA